MFHGGGQSSNFEFEIVISSDLARFVGWKVHQSTEQALERRVHLFPARVVVSQDNLGLH
jgi:hypothetical protein